jgi:hypothetical protein
VHRSQWPGRLCALSILLRMGIDHGPKYQGRRS